ncbi:molybdate ABC transporter permease subunit [Lutispora sp.]|uniref:molybdate ABC transporter permease subunit n=1 Tax=Lutispora sp. TaxID=2828727 RepID=UPI000EC631BA|nr:molybdate ABC transporter permease subunit [Lutispora sp.]MEA4960875.1 molybdate ABC transporter permease subunit [Lutispora sp.]HCJ58616.1 molybdate ABC transporter permease subunit [Clostridiaceae bacterium]
MILKPMLLSLKIASIATIFSLIIGVYLAKVMTKKDFPGKNAAEVLITLPMVLPPSVTGYILLILFGRRGIIGSWLYSMGISLVFSWTGAVMAACIVSLPLMYQSVKASLINVDPVFQKAARTLGASESRIFWTVTLPLAWPGIVSGVALTFARSLGEFGATLMIAGNIPGKTQTIPLAIYFASDSGDMVTANILVGIMTAFSFILIYSLNSWLKKKNFHSIG